MASRFPLRSWGARLVVRSGFRAAVAATPLLDPCRASRARSGQPTSGALYICDKDDDWGKNKASCMPSFQHRRFRLLGQRCRSGWGNQTLALLHLEVFMV